MADPSPDLNRRVRPLRPEDLERTIVIDQMHTGRARRRFFERRLRAAKEQPKDFIHVGIDDDRGLVGFAFARLLQGEFGREQMTAALDLFGVDPERRTHGYGYALMEGLAQVMREKGVRTLHSQATWSDHELLKFFASTGFKLAPRLVLERAVAEQLAEPVDEP